MEEATQVLRVWSKEAEHLKNFRSRLRTIMSTSNGKDEDELVMDDDKLLTTLSNLVGQQHFREEQEVPRLGMSKHDMLPNRVVQHFMYLFQVCLRLATQACSSG